MRGRSAFLSLGDPGSGASRRDTIARHKALGHRQTVLTQDVAHCAVLGRASRVPGTAPRLSSAWELPHTARHYSAMATTG
jgi:hypothetical protein